MTKFGQNPFKYVEESNCQKERRNLKLRHLKGHKVVMFSVGCFICLCLPFYDVASDFVDL